MKSRNMIVVSAVVAGLTLAGAAQASVEQDVRHYAPNADLSNLTKQDKNELTMILYGGERDSDKRNRVRNVIRKSNER